MRNIGILGAIVAAGAVAVSSRGEDIFRVDDWPEPRRKKTPGLFKLADQAGPVIDTTRESKRARRRRLAKEDRSNAS